VRFRVCDRPYTYISMYCFALLYLVRYKDISFFKINLNGV
jgi:hypothetical protein